MALLWCSSANCCAPPMLLEQLRCYWDGSPLQVRPCPDRVAGPPAQVDEEASIRANTTVLLGNIAKYLVGVGRHCGQGRATPANLWIGATGARSRWAHVRPSSREDGGSSAAGAVDP
jgi:hypothetical protein